MKRQAQRKSGYFWEVALHVIKNMFYHQCKMIFATSQKYLVWHIVHKEWLGKAFLILQVPDGNQALFTFDECTRAGHKCKEVS